MEELILGSIPKNFNIKQHIPIAPYCFLGKESYYPDFENLEFICIVENEDKLVSYDEKATKEAVGLVSDLAKELYPEYFKNHSFDYWHLILYSWLGHIIPFFYRKKILLEKIIDKYGDKELRVKLLKKNSLRRVQDDSEFLELMNDPIFSHWLLSRLIEVNKPSAWLIEYTDDEIHLTYNQRKVKNKIKRIFTKFLPFFKRVYGFSFLDVVIFNFISFIKPKIKTNGERENLFKINLDEKIDWNLDIIKLLKIIIPHDYLSIKLKKSYFSGKVFNFSNELFFNLDAKLNAAAAFEKGNIITCSQHGGHNYGSALTFEFNNYLEYNLDYFVSWGWSEYKGKEKENFALLPSPLLSKYANKHKVKSHGLIYVGTKMNLLKNRFDSGPNEIDWINYRKSKVKIFNDLDKYDVLNKIKYKPYRQVKGGLEDELFFKRLFPQMLISKGDLHKELVNSSLLVLDHPGTTWNIAMAMNVPTLLYWNPKWFPFNETAKKYLNRFKELNIYHENEDSLIKQILYLNVKKNSEVINNWWYSDQIQKLRVEWMHNYAMIDENWQKKWLKFLWNYKK